MKLIRILLTLSLISLIFALTLSVEEKRDEEIDGNVENSLLRENEEIKNKSIKKTLKKKSRQQVSQPNKAAAQGINKAILANLGNGNRRPNQQLNNSLKQNFNKGHGRNLNQNIARSLGGNNRNPNQNLRRPLQKFKNHRQQSGGTTAEAPSSIIVGVPPSNVNNANNFNTPKRKSIKGKNRGKNNIRKKKNFRQTAEAPASFNVGVASPTVNNGNNFNASRGLSQNRNRKGKGKGKKRNTKTKQSFKKA